MSGANKPTYEELQDRVVFLEQLVQRLEAIVNEQNERIKKLENDLAKYRKNSSNSSKPPSSDIVKPPKEQKENSGRKIGAQPGHEKHWRPLFKAEHIDGIHTHTLACCPVCNGALVPANDSPRVVQQIEIMEAPVRVDEHRGIAYWCERCGKAHYAPLPPAVEKGGLFGPRMTTIAAYMKGCCHASYSTIQCFFKDVAGVNISRGQLAKIVAKAASAIQTPYMELLNAIPDESKVNADETGHKENGDKYWTWCFRADLYVLFRIDKSRGSKVLIDVLGAEFNGVLGCDYFSSYRKYMKDFDILVQFCIAHLIRDIKFLATVPDKATNAYAERLLDEIRGMFDIIHRHKAFPGDSFADALSGQKARILLAATTDVPDAKPARNMARRFANHGEAYFQFITTPGMEPTNNIAEQAVRFVVIDRLITQGTRSEKGRRWCERIWSVMATCAIQNRSPFTFLLDAINSFFAGEAPPSLLPSPL